ncbi:amidohydrolase [Nocardioides sp. B-3]|uniref:amidohydrolase n=1 Tax=Nocardioides sp. B-3 TaxID=2895565 RepID=UPI002153A11E|nr:amidohydrolase family protein [Nocardioides sp. B-3]
MPTSLLREAGHPGLRVHKAVRSPDLELALAEGRRTGDGDDWFRTGPVKLFSDGALGSRTCHMSHDFADQQGNHGIAVTPYADLLAQVRSANGAGLAVAVHAIGDRANQLVLDAFEAAGPVGLRNRIEHAQHLRPVDVQRMARLGIVASMQPTHCTSDIDLAEQLLGDRDSASYARRSLLNAGVPLAFGSDAPVEEANPFHAMYAAMTRTRPDGTPDGGWQPGQRLSAGEALTAHTLGSAWAAGEDHRKGVLAPGFLADFVVVDTDPHVAPPEAVRAATVLTTVVGGLVRWQHDRSTQPTRA